MWNLTYAYVFIFALISSLIIIGQTRKLAIRFNIVDVPDSRRKIHTVSMPLLGGVGMYTAFIFTIGLNLAAVYLMKDSGILPDSISLYIKGITARMPQIFAIAFTVLGMVILGTVDDVKRLSAKVKLAFQIALALIVFFSGIRVSLFIPNYFISALLTVGWIVGITNAYNLLDNMDGLSCGTALISSLIFFLVAFSHAHFFVATILACFAGVLLGFLFFNFPPARMFMGDAGSLFIGYTLSLLTILNTFYTPDASLTPAPIIMPVLILLVPIFDTLSVICIRIRNKVSIFTPDKNHFSHRLVNRGMSAKQAVLFIYLVSFCLGLGAFLLTYLDKKGCMIVLLQAACILAIIVLLERESH
ncbi:MAG: undecaprenyl/decaprenyl-phosphate alpha-N-acetylglucosaminyl 1-phosphate transferase [Candidatus Omnitrophica bacterium]|nr:undecaprenyl/decaprenyl-phosphate alpha-N-acetylglucosaminyl 1-phosphate transferase [Candidatus Omnitrophota bacterium]MBU4478798.1 undecaprenyl/decaprenyl-phosphate alpha-N-acetylglucosaminyl 1-phosphate transferase [Candidatus Omnitrophota bacterium]